ncbi:formylglycine-generating enzyme family protein [Streptomyces sp. NPDC048483]|uniref:formylglycine-generating enzyme family protein n=1 Tax=Streptomyces sp. NPDC048483 TaxID=3154927 RepID=UPI00341E0DAD
MSLESTLREAIAERMIGIPAGEIVLRDEGTKTNWKAEVGAFRLAPYPVTRELYLAVLGETPVSSAGPRVPVTEISWKEAVRFCNLLSQATGLEPCYAMGDGPDAPDDPDAQDVVCDWEADGYRLPAEAEWEYACRAGTPDVRYGELDEIAWYRGNSGDEVHDVATRAPNAWGLYDMIGNVWEWCWDVYDPSVYGPYRVFRGGGAYDQPRGCRASCRRKSHPTFRVDDLGFRLARSLQ